MTEKVTAIVNYEATEDWQLSLAEGDFIEVIKKDDVDDDGLWYGKNLLGKKEGWFPASCVQKKVSKIARKSVEESKVQQQQRPEKPSKPAIALKTKKEDTIILEPPPPLPPVKEPPPLIIAKTTPFEPQSSDVTVTPKEPVFAVTNGYRSSSSLAIEEEAPKHELKRNSVVLDDQSADFIDSLESTLQKLPQSPQDIYQHFRNSRIKTTEPAGEFSDFDEDEDEVEENDSGCTKAQIPLDIAVAIDSFEAASYEQLTLNNYDIVEVYEKTSDDWWKGRLQNSSDSTTLLKWVPVNRLKCINLSQYIQQHDEKHQQQLQQQLQQQQQQRETEQKTETEDENIYVIKTSSFKSQILNGPKKLFQKASASVLSAPAMSRWNSFGSLNASPTKENNKRFSISKEISIDEVDSGTKGTEKPCDDGQNELEEEGNTDQSSLSSYSTLLYSVQTMSTSKKRDDTVEHHDDAKSTKQEKRRQNIINEMITTENKYLRDLYFLMTNFQQTLTNNGLLTESESTIIFRNIRPIYETNLEVYNIIYDRLLSAETSNDNNDNDNDNNNNSNKIGDLLLVHVRSMTPLYIEYSSGHQAAVDKLSVKVQNDPQLGDFIKSVSHEHPEYYLPLELYLAKPITRPLQWPTLLGQLLKNTPPESADYSDCQQALELVKELCRAMDGVKLRPGEGAHFRGWKQFEQLSWLQSHLLFSSADQLIDFNSETAFLGYRRLLYATLLHNMINLKTVALFLFNDVLVIGVPQGQRLTDVQQVTSFFDCPQALECNYRLLFGKALLLEEVEYGKRFKMSSDLKMTFAAGGKRVELQAATEEQFDELCGKLVSAKVEYESIRRINNEYNRGRSEVRLAGQPRATLELKNIDAVQLYTTNYSLNAYCKVAIGTEWATAHSVETTKVINVKLTPTTTPKGGNKFSFSSLTRSRSIRSGAEAAFPSASSSADSFSEQDMIRWKVNQKLPVYSAEDCLLIRVYNQSRYSAHQLLGETSMALSEAIAQAKTLRNIGKGLLLVLPNGRLGEQLQRSYQIKPCLRVNYNIVLSTSL